MDKVITTALFIVISMILAIMLFNMAYPAIQQGGDAVTSMAYNVSDRMRYQIAAIHASAEYANGTWWDANGNGQFEVSAWVKNTGEARVVGLEQLDVFFGPEGNFARIPSQAAAGGTFPYWTAQVENASDWDPTTTLRITIHYQMAVASGRYFLKVTLPNGVSSEYYLGI